ncbi:armadillo-type protein [Mycena maculata]|uniref:Armadillo-type protein n=1 Tax=Mycena maculata TaxID=230809 RepID=A0AAD7NA10_9AGAR|nr:armadillo-type protein [Mycena maculata]
MPPLTRQPTIESLLSWWSDSNPPGASISLHAAAKPLMKLMYHQQALDFIEANRGVPLSDFNVDICSRYLAFKYISPRTQGLILDELANRCLSNTDADTVMDSAVVDSDLVEMLLQSKSSEVRRGACKLLGHLSEDQDTAAAISAGNVCGRLLSLLRDEDVDSLAMYALACIAHWPSGAYALAVGNGEMLEPITYVLRSTRTRTRVWACSFLANMGSHEATAPVIFRLNACEWVVSLLQDEHGIEVIAASMDALAKISQRPDGARAVVIANGLEPVLKLLTSPVVRSSACMVVGNLARHEATIFRLLMSLPCVHLVPLLEYQNNRIIASAIYALSEISKWREGARLVVSAGALERISDLLASSDAEILISTCSMLEILGRQTSIAMAISATRPCNQLVALLSDPVGAVRTSALAVLTQISGTPGGAAVVANTDVFEHISELMEMPDQKILTPVLEVEYPTVQVLFQCFLVIDPPVKEGLMLYMARVDCYLISGAEISLDVDNSLIKEHLDAQHLFLRRLLGINSRSMLAVLFTETGLMPIRIRRLLLALARLQYMIRLGDERIVRAAMLDSVDLFANGHSGWAGDLAIMLRTMPTPIHISAADFLSPLTVDTIIKKVVEVVDADLQFDVDFLQKTHLLRNRLETVEEKCILVTRRRRHYLTMVHVPAHRKALTRLLLSDHNLSVERLRYPVRYRRAIPREERLCRFCQVGVEDEVHALLDRIAHPPLSDLRERTSSLMCSLADIVQGCGYPVRKDPEIVVNITGMSSLYSLDLY